ncbi:hypothetical protein NX059_002782 [Plenodomus lindquistii]|nr:hypothetical protein NX059_002782 [Plenodomus lindquistii]
MVGSASSNCTGVSGSHSSNCTGLQGNGMAAHPQGCTCSHCTRNTTLAHALTCTCRHCTDMHLKQRYNITFSHGDDCTCPACTTHSRFNASLPRPHNITGFEMDAGLNLTKRVSDSANEKNGWSSGSSAGALVGIIIGAMLVSVLGYLVAVELGKRRDAAALARHDLEATAHASRQSRTVPVPEAFEMMPLAGGDLGARPALRHGDNLGVHPALRRLPQVHLGVHPALRQGGDIESSARNSVGEVPPPYVGDDASPPMYVGASQPKRQSGPPAYGEFEEVDITDSRSAREL